MLLSKPFAKIVKNLLSQKIKDRDFANVVVLKVSTTKKDRRFRNNKGKRLQKASNSTTKKTPPPKNRGLDNEKLLGKRPRQEKNPKISTT